MIRRKIFISEIFVIILLAMCLNGTLGFPSSYSYKELNPPLLVTTVPTIYRDKFRLNKQVLPITKDVKTPAKSEGVRGLIPVIKPQKVWKPQPVRQNDDPKTKSWKGQKKQAHAVNAINPKSSLLKPIRRLSDDPKKVKKTRKHHHGVGELLSDKRRQNDDDDDDDDGGEYEGLDSNNNGGKKEKKSMPMMIIRGFDVMAMDMPVGNAQKKCKQSPAEAGEAPPPEEAEEVQPEAEPEPEPEEKEPEEPETMPEEVAEKPGCDHEEPTTPEEVEPEVKKDACLTDEAQESWGEWSSCSKSCGMGVQSRSRTDPSGTPERDTEFRPCHLAECPEPRVYDGVRVPGYGTDKNLKIGPEKNNWV